MFDVRCLFIQLDAPTVRQSMVVPDIDGAALVTRRVYVALTIVLLRVVALPVTVGAVPVTTTVYIPCLTPLSILPVMVPEVRVSPLGRPPDPVGLVSVVLVTV